MATRHMLPAKPVGRPLRRRTDAARINAISASESPTLDAARRIHWLRRRRDNLFGDGLFFDPGWDILLSLYIAAHDARPMSVCDICMGTTLPQTTVLRWISQLAGAGLVVKGDDPTDARRVNIRLTSRAVRKMNMLLRDAAQAPILFAETNMMAAE